MKLVGSGLQGDVDDGTHRAAKLGLEVVGGDVHVLDCRRGRNEDDVDAGALVVVDTFNLIEIDVGGLAVRVGGEIVVGVVELRIVEDHGRHARNYVQQGLKAVAAAERKIGDLILLDRGRNVGAIRLQLGWSRGDYYRLRDAAGNQADIDALRGVCGESDVLAGLFLESGRGDRHGIQPGRKIRCGIVAALIGDK